MGKIGCERHRPVSSEAMMDRLGRDNEVAPLDTGQDVWRTERNKPGAHIQVSLHLHIK